MNNCPKCGNPLQNGMTSCPICGTQFATTQLTNNQMNNMVNNVAPQANQIPNTTVAQTTVQPQPIQQPMPMPTASNQIANASENPQVVQQKVKKKVKINKKVLIIFIILIVCAIGIYIFLGSGSKTKKKNTQTQVTTAEYVDVATNGFKFKIEKEWYVKEGNDTIIVKDNKSRILIKLEKYNSSFSEYSKQKIEDYLKNNRQDLKEVNVSELEIEAKQVITVEAKIKEDNKEEKTAKYYYVKASDNMIIGATIIYLDETSKDDINGSITTFIGSLNYYDETSAVLKDISEYSTIFGVYGNIISSTNKTPLQEKESPIIPNTNQENQNDENQVNTQENQANIP